MDTFQPGDVLYAQFIVTDNSGEQVAADDTPTVSVYRNHVLDSAVSAGASISHQGNGLYFVSATTPAYYLPGDYVHIQVALDVDASSINGVILQARAQFRSPSVLEHRLHTFGGEVLFVDPNAYLSEELSEGLGDFPSQAFETLADALDAAVSGQVVLLMPGDHILSGNLVVPAGVSVSGSNLRLSRIVRQDSGDSGSTSIITLRSNCRLANLSVLDQTTNGVNGVDSFTSLADGVVIDDVYIESQYTGVLLDSTGPAHWHVYNTEVHAATTGLHVLNAAHTVDIRFAEIRTISTDQDGTSSSTRRDVVGISLDDASRVEVADTTIVSDQDDSGASNIAVLTDGGAYIRIAKGIVAADGGDPAYDFKTTSATDKIQIGGGTLYRASAVNSAGGTGTFVREPVADAIDAIEISSSSESISVDLTEITADIADLTTDVTALQTSLNDGLDALYAEHDDIIASIGSVAGSVSDNAVVVDHDFGGTDELAIQDPDGIGIENAVIKIYLKSDYDAMNRSSTYLKGQTYSTTYGRWQQSIPLDPGTYVVVAFKQNLYNTVAAEFTVPSS